MDRFFEECGPCEWSQSAVTRRVTWGTELAADIDALEAEIDQAVYDLFELTDGERAVVEDYLEVF